MLFISSFTAQQPLFCPFALFCYFIARRLWGCRILWQYRRGEGACLDLGLNPWRRRRWAWRSFFLWTAETRAVWRPSSRRRLPRLRTPVGTFFPLPRLFLRSVAIPAHLSLVYCFLLLSFSKFVIVLLLIDMIFVTGWFLMNVVLGCQSLNPNYPVFLTK